MKISYKVNNFRSSSLTMIELCNSIIGQYQEQGLRLTLRQLYYQLVTRNAIRNEERAYKSLGNLVSDGRLSGLIDWDAIEDRVRVPRRPSEFANLGELVDAALYTYRLPRWQGQVHYVELWVEKDAISGVLAPMASQYHVTLMVNRGYSSQSAMFESANRFKASKNPGILLYLGDHDPSGEDMVRDIQERLDMFGSNVEVSKIALTMAQVEEYGPPPNPTKHTDTRSPTYIGKYGEECWEVDALPPDVLHQIVEDSILGYVDMERMNTIKAQEKQDKEKLKSFVKGLS